MATTTASIQQLFVDFSGLTPKQTSDALFETPYDVLIDACSDDPELIAAAYEMHRVTRNAHQRKQLLAPEFSGMNIDPILQELVYVAGTQRIPELEGTKKRRPEEIDMRNCLTFWARPTEMVKDLVWEVQAKLKKLNSDIWLMPRDNLHLTVLEIAHSRTPEEIEDIAALMRSHLQRMVDLPASEKRRTALVKPMLSFDASALAISFVPEVDDAGYTYHHLRRDFYKLSVESGVVIGSRYTVPSAHITVARFVTGGKYDRRKMEEWTEGIEKINAWIQEEWSQRVRWVVGAERGVEFRRGILWYGGGRSAATGQGF